MREALSGPLSGEGGRVASEQQLVLVPNVSGHSTRRESETDRNVRMDAPWPT